MMSSHWRSAWKTSLLVAFLNLPALGAEQPAEVAARKEYFLKYRLSVNVSREFGTGGQSLELTARPSLPEEPKYQSREPLYATVLLGPKRDRFTLVLDNSKGGNQGYDILYADTQRSGRISTAEKFSSFLTSSGTLFGPVKFMVDYGQETCPQWFLFRLSERMEGKEGQSQSLVAINAGYYEGVVTFGDQKRRVTLVDADGNGLYNDFLKGENQGCDRVLIGASVPDRGFASPKAQPLARYLLVGDRYWQLEVAPDGSSLAVEPLNKPLGTIRLGQRNCTLLLSNEECLLRVQSTTGVARVPAGKYGLAECHYSLGDSDGRIWTFSSATKSGATVEVPANGEVKIPLGPPLVPKVAVTLLEEGHLALTMSLSGAGGEMVGSVQLGGVGKPARPQARILDSNGRELGVVDFHFG